MGTILLAPPITFLVFLAISMGFSSFAGKFAAKGEDAPNKTKSYACGEDVEQTQGQPDYSEFFKFAFFFTIIHVVVLIVATDPFGISVMSVLYLVATVLSLFLLFRR